MMQNLSPLLWICVCLFRFCIFGFKNFLQKRRIGCGIKRDLTLSSYIFCHTYAVEKYLDKFFTSCLTKISLSPSVWWPSGGLPVGWRSRPRPSSMASTRWYRYSGSSTLMRGSSRYVNVIIGIWNIRYVRNWSEQTLFKTKGLRLAWRPS